MPRVIQIVTDTCVQCPHFRKKGDRFGHGTYQHHTCNLTKQKLQGHYVVKIPGSCPMPEATSHG